MNQGESIAVLGKLPTRGDFLRSELTHDAERAFEDWLQTCVEQSRGKVPNHAVRFLITPDQSKTALIGTFIPSRDLVGREFPLVLMLRVPEDVAAVPWPLIPVYYESFLTLAEGCLGGAEHDTFEHLVDAARALPLPHPSSLPRMLHDGLEILAVQRVCPFGAQVFGEGALDPLPYALVTLSKAATQQELTIDLPSPTLSDLYIWLELTNACLAEGERPGALLWARHEGRALASLGRPSDQSFSFLLEPDHSSQRRWPVWTKRIGASEAARESLSAPLLDALARDATVEELIVLLRAEALA